MENKEFTSMSEEEFIELLSAGNEEMEKGIKEMKMPKELDGPFNELIALMDENNISPILYFEKKLGIDWDKTPENFYTFEMFQLLKYKFSVMEPESALQLIEEVKTEMREPEMISADVIHKATADLPDRVAVELIGEINEKNKDIAH